MEKDTEKQTERGKKEQVWKGRTLEMQIAESANRREICRYLGYRGERPERREEELVESCIEELAGCLSPRFYGREYPFSIMQDGSLDFTCFQARSESLRKNLEGCHRVFLFGATLGAGVDLLLRRYSVIKMSRAVVMQAAAAAMIEAYCNLENRRLAEEFGKRGLFVRPRFSPGYGDFSLEYQRSFASALELEKRTGITLTDSLLMMPSKSVTAVIGLSREACPQPGAAGGRGCEVCKKEDCMYRERPEPQKARGEGAQPDRGQIQITDTDNKSC